MGHTPVEPLPMTQDMDDTPAGRAVFAKRAVHFCVVAIPDLPLAEMLCLVMDDADRLGRAVGQHIARAVGEVYEENPRLHARPAPLALVLELREKLGERLVRRLEAPLAPESMRVLWLAPSQRHVFDVAIDAHTLVQTRNAMMDEEEEDVPDAGPTRAVVGTWRDPMRYLPMPLPAGWAIDGLDRLGVLHVIIDDRFDCQMGALEPEQGKCLFVIFDTLDGGPDVSDEEARAVLDRMRNVRPFGELAGMEELFGENRVFAAPIVEGAPIGSG